jgi:hypothetical protein
MPKKTMQIRIATGQGFFKDQDFGAYEGLTDEQFQELADHYQLAAVGSMLDFLDVDRVRGLLERGKPITEADLQGFQTEFNGQVFEAGTVYGVIVGEESSLALELVHANLQEKASGDRVVAAAQDPAFKASPEARPAPTSGADLTRAPKAGGKGLATLTERMKKRGSSAEEGT